MSIYNFEILQELGKGTFASVYKVKRNTDNKTYAMKRVQMSSLSPKEKENALNEIRILASINSNNVVTYKEAFFNEANQSLYIIMDYLDDGDLEQKIAMYKKFKSHFSEKEIWNILRQIALGLKAMHSKNILHRDLKSANIFITKKGLVKIGDMNVSKVNKEGLVNTQTGTPYYASPEVWKDLPYNHKSDIWSLGCIVYEMCCLKLPFTGRSFEEVYLKITRLSYPPIPVNYSADMSNMISGLLSFIPSHRPSVDNIIKTISNLKLFEHNNSTVEDLQSENGSNVMIQTLKMPLVLKDINKFLPKAKYIPTNRIIQSAYGGGGVKKEKENHNITCHNMTSMININKQRQQHQKNLAPLNKRGFSKGRSPKKETSPDKLPDIIPSNFANYNTGAIEASRNTKLAKLNRNYSSNIKLLPTASSNNITTISNKSNSNSGSGFDIQLGEAEPIQGILNLRRKYLNRIGTGKKNSLATLSSNNNSESISNIHSINNLQISTEGNDLILPIVHENRQILPKVISKKKGKVHDIRGLPFYPLDYKFKAIIPEDRKTNDTYCIK